jgi:hypothetical protein
MWTMGLLAGLAATPAAPGGTPISNAFTYQGRLMSDGAPYEGEASVVFRLYDDDLGGTLLDSDSDNDLAVSGGLLTKNLAFSAAMNGEARWLEIEVNGTILEPRQEILPAPYALALPYLRAVRSDQSPNLLGGHADNFIMPFTDGVVIGGGGIGGESHSASDDFCVISGGFGNRAGNDDADDGNAIAATVSGGRNNGATAYYATVGGGRDNTADGWYTTISGGNINAASGYAAVVPGGWKNTAEGARSFAGGHFAQALHDGSFVWADDLATPFASSDPNTFSVRARGGVYFVTGVSGGSATSGVHLPSGSGSWSNLSDRDAKEAFDEIDGDELLERLETMPVTTWQYRAQDGDVRHMGPTAQDFAEAFDLGGDERRISAVDADGVALAAAKALAERCRAQAAEIATLNDRLARLEALVEDSVDR